MAITEMNGPKVNFRLSKTEPYAGISSTAVGYSSSHFLARENLGSKNPTDTGTIRREDSRETEPSRTLRDLMFRVGG